MAAIKRLNTMDRALAAFLIYHDSVLDEKVDTGDGRPIYKLTGNAKMKKLAAAWGDLDDTVCAGRYIEIWERIG